MKDSFFINKYLKNITKSTSISGLTLLELILSVFIGGIVISSLLWLMNNVLQASRNENIKRETSQSLSLALDYITEDVQEALYVYDGEQLSDLLAYLPFGDNSDLTPILAFWKIEPVPYESTQSLPGNCNTFTGDLQTECQNLKLERKSSTLIVYLLSTENPQDLWEGNARIERYQLRKYSDPSTLSKNTGYVDPLRDASLPHWPKTSEDGSSLQASLPTLDDSNKFPVVDFVYVNNSAPEELPNLSSCVTPPHPVGEVYRPSPEYIANEANEYPRGFYTCLSFQDTSPADGVADNSDNTQYTNRELRIFLLGSTEGKVTTSKPVTEVLQSQVITRGLYDRQGLD